MTRSLFFLALVAFSVPTFAEPAPVAVHVDARGLDLSTAKGRGQLRQRLSHAARDVCAASATDLSGRNAEEQCRRDAVDTALARTVGDALASR